MKKVVCTICLVAILLIVVEMLISAGGCTNSLTKESSAKFEYYTDTQQDSQNEYFDVQKFIHDSDKEFFKEQKPWIQLYTVSSLILFPYEYFAFSSVPYIPYSLGQ